MVPGMANARETAAGLGDLRRTYERTIDGWLRPGLNGWRFTDTQGRVYRLDDEDGRQIHAAALEKIDELFASLEGQVWYMLIPAVLVGMLGLRMADEFLLYGAMPTAIYFVPCLMFLFKDVIAEVRFAIAMNRWRGDLARHLRAASGESEANDEYSLLNDTRLGVWIGWALLGPGMIGTLLFYGNAELLFLSLGMLGAGTFVLRGAYNIDG